MLTPLVVRRHEGRYILIAGERRFRAAGLAGLHEVPVVVRDAETPAEQLELALVENLQRADLDAIEEGRGYDRLIDRVCVHPGRGREEGRQEPPDGRERMRLLKLPEFGLKALREGRISAGHARAMLPLEEPDMRRLLAKIIAQQLSVRQTERLVTEMTRTVVTRARATRERKQTMDYATKLLRDSLRTSVEIKPLKKGGGRIVIDYADAEDLERLIHRLRES